VFLTEHPTDSGPDEKIVIGNVPWLRTYEGMVPISMQCTNNLREIIFNTNFFNTIVCILLTRNFLTQNFWIFEHDFLT